MIIPSISEVQAILAKQGFKHGPLTAKAWKTKWYQMKRTAKVRGIGFSLTFQQYMALARKAGLQRSSQIGKTKGKYQVGRLGDTGPYAKGNCRFITMEANQAECVSNGIRAQGGLKTGKALLGRTKESHAYIAEVAQKISAKTKGWTKETHEHKRRQAEKVSKFFEVVSPKGRVYRGRNITEFSKSKNLNVNCMRRLCGGYRNSHQGWIGKYIERAS